VAISIVYPADDPVLGTELETLRRYLPPATHIIVGGRSAGAYATVLSAIKAHRVADLRELSAVLNRIRTDPSN
jgi:hypothetical protein